jgi:hypothetical protein
LTIERAVVGERRIDQPSSRRRQAIDRLPLGQLDAEKPVPRCDPLLRSQEVTTPQLEGLTHLGPLSIDQLR